jgi:hypothetical protein
MNFIKKYKLTLFALALFIFTLSIYIINLCPTVAAGDSGDLTVACAVTGIPHPPGYPLYTMLGKLFTFLPHGEIAWRVNLFSAVCHSLTVLFIFLAIFNITGSVCSASTGALLLAFSGIFWHYAEVAEVFPLNNLFLALLLFLSTKLAKLQQEPIDKRPETKSQEPKTKKKEPRRKNQGTRNQPPTAQLKLKLILLLAFFAGLSLSNHHTILFTFPAFFYLLWQERKIILAQKTFILCLLLFLSGFLPYLYLPIAAAQSPPLNWDNPTNLSQFINIILRKDYGSFSLLSKEAKETPTPRWQHIPIYIKSLWEQFTPLGFVLALLGMVYLYKTRRRISHFLWWAFGLSSFGFQLFANMPTSKTLLLGVLERFYLLPAVTFALWVGAGAYWILSLLRPLIEPKPALKLLFPILLILAAFLLPYNYHKTANDFSQNYIARDYGRNILSCLKPGALFFSHSDAATMNVDYVQMVLKERPDVITLDQEKLTYVWYCDEVRKRLPQVIIPGVRYDGVKTFNINIIDANWGKFPIYFFDFKEDSYKQKYVDKPMGLVREIFLKGQGPDFNQLVALNAGLEAQFVHTGKTTGYPPTSFEYAINQAYALPSFNLAYEADIQNFILQPFNIIKKLYSWLRIICPLIKISALFMPIRDV